MPFLENGKGQEWTEVLWGEVESSQVGDVLQDFITLVLQENGESQILEWVLTKVWVLDVNGLWGSLSLSQTEFLDKVLNWVQTLEVNGKENWVQDWSGNSVILR